MQLEFFRVEIFFASRLARRRPTVLERRTVDAVVTRQRGRQHEPCHERRPAADLQRLGQNIGRIRPEIGSEEFAHRAAVQLREVLCQLLLRIPPCKVRVRLREAKLRQPVHHFWPRERFRQEKSHRDVRDCTSPITHSQNANGFVCGLSTRKIRTPCSIQNKKTLFSSSHSDCQSSRFEIERIDVLIFLGRIFRILDRAIGPLAKPFGMLAHIRMIGRALKRDIQRQLDPCFSAARTSELKIVERSKLRMNRLVAALFAADSPRAADVAAGQLRSRCFAFAMRAPDRMNRRQVKHVESHRCDVRQTRFDIFERAVAASPAAERGNNSYQALKLAFGRSTITRKSV